MTALDEFLGSCASAIVRMATLLDKNDARRAGAVAFAAAAEAATPDPPAAGAGGSAHSGSLVPVIAHLAELVPGPIVDEYRAAESEIPWIPSHRMDDGGTDAALAPLNNVRDFGPVQVGLLALRAGSTYPVHSHPPQELYLPIADGGLWRFGGSDGYRALAADELVYNNPNDVHSIVAGSTPLLALYVLWPD